MPLVSLLAVVVAVVADADAVIAFAVIAFVALAFAAVDADTLRVFVSAVVACFRVR